MAHTYTADPIDEVGLDDNEFLARFTGADEWDRDWDQFTATVAGDRGHRAWASRQLESTVEVLVAEALTRLAVRRPC